MELESAPKNVVAAWNWGLLKDPASHLSWLHASRLVTSAELPEKHPLLSTSAKQSQKGPALKLRQSTSKSFSRSALRRLTRPVWERRTAWIRAVDTEVGGSLTTDFVSAMLNMLKIPLSSSEESVESFSSPGLDSFIFTSHLVSRYIPRALTSMFLQNVALVPKSIWHCSSAL